MYIELNFKSGKPTYLQIIEQIKYALATGALRDGDQLPSIRALAEQLRINRNTVAKAYGDLETEGIVKTEQGRGVFCTAEQSALTAAARRRIVAKALDGVIVEAWHLSMTDADLIQLLRDRLKAFQERVKESEAKTETR